MKNIKKITCLMLAMIMIFALSATAFAKTNITINDSDNSTGTAYVAYKLLNATNALDESNQPTNKFAYTLNSKYTAVLQTVTGKTTEAEIIAYIAAQNTDDTIRAFADSVYAQIKTNSIEPDLTSTDKAFSVDEGYYLIAETTTSGHPDTISLVMLDTAGKGDIQVTTKESAPTVVKKVKDTDDSTGAVTDWQDSADYDINDEIPYKVTGTLSSHYANYKTYYYSFSDTMTHLTYKTGSFAVTVGEGGKDITSSFTPDWNNGTKTLTVTCNDLKAITDSGITASSEIVLTYTATLDADANIGATGNPNEVKLIYNNNPYYDGTGTPTNGETPVDKNIVFTFNGIVNKVDGNSQPLAGATFTLYKLEKPAGGGNPEYVVYKNGLTPDSAGTTFTAKGLDAGQYKIVETHAPDGYNKVADIEFTIKATHQTEADSPILQTLTVEGNTDVHPNKDAGTVTTDVINRSGTELPSTGGIGTTIFYVLGSMLVLGAGVVLVAKRRVKAE